MDNYSTTATPQIQTMTAQAPQMKRNPFLNPAPRPMMPQMQPFQPAGMPNLPHMPSAQEAFQNIQSRFPQLGSINIPGIPAGGPQIPQIRDRIAQAMAARHNPSM